MVLPLPWLVNGAAAPLGLQPPAQERLRPTMVPAAPANYGAAASGPSTTGTGATTANYGANYGSHARERSGSITKKDVNIFNLVSVPAGKTSIRLTILNSKEYLQNHTIALDPALLREEENIIVNMIKRILSLLLDCLMYTASTVEGMEGGLAKATIGNVLSQVLSAVPEGHTHIFGSDLTHLFTLCLPNPTNNAGSSFQTFILGLRLVYYTMTARKANTNLSVRLLLRDFALADLGLRHFCSSSSSPLRLPDSLRRKGRPVP